MNITLLIGIICLAIAGYIWLTYNGLITVKMRVSEALSQIDVQLKRRADLIPNLVETVKGYAKHEKELLETVTKARAHLVAAKDMGAKATANNQLSDSLKSLFIAVENYPNLKANENFLDLQNELSDTEDKIAYARQFYNSAVLDYNTKLQIFPTVLFGNMLHFTPAEFFAASEEEKKPVKVSF